MRGPPAGAPRSGRRALAAGMSGACAEPYVEHHGLFMAERGAKPG
jgi:hypothetical protein